MQIDLIETFKSCVLPQNKTQSIGGFPLQFIIPDEYLQPGITLSDLQDKNVSIQNSISTRNRFIQAVLKNNVKLPILQSTTESIALGDVEKKDNTCTIASAVSVQQYLADHPDSKLSVLDVVDSLYVYIVVSSKSDIFDIQDLKQKTVACGLSGTASNEFVHLLMKSLSWRKNTDLIVNEQVPDATLLHKLLSGDNPQVDAAIIVDTYPSQIVREIIKDESNNWRIISVPNSPSNKWNNNVISYNMLNQSSNGSQIHTIMTPLVMVSNSDYSIDSLMKFASFTKNPFMQYDLQNVLQTYKLPLHPTSYKIYQNLGILN